MKRGTGKDILLQAFHWNLVKTQGTGTLANSPHTWYQILLSMVPKIADTGFTVVYLPPPWVDDSSWSNGAKHGGGEGYFWRDFDLNSRYGTKTQLTALVSALHEKNIKVIVDLVTNHRDRYRMQKDLWAYPGPHWANGGEDTGTRFMDGSCDLALDNHEVQKRILAAMNELLDECGIDGWRWDYVWGYAIDDVLDWISKTNKDEYMSVGEYWQSTNKNLSDPLIQKYGTEEGNRILGWARDSKGLAFDIILKRNINTGIAENLKFGLNCRMEKDEREAVVTFVDNHDMGPSPYSPASGYGQECWPCPPNFRSKAYAFIMSMPGTPCVYWPDVYDWGLETEIRELAKLRKKAGIVSGSEWQDLTYKHSGFAGIVKNSSGKDALAISIDSNFRANISDGWKLGYERMGEWSVWIQE